MRRAAAILAVVCWPLSLGASDLVVGSAGETYELLVGTQAELFGVGGEEGDYLALGLSIQGFDENASLVRVPGTETPGPERQPHLVWEGSTKSLIILWQDDTTMPPAIHVLTYREGLFSSQASIAEERLVGAQVQLHVADSILEAVDGERSSRTVLHLTWRDAEGSVLWMPIVLLDGSFTGVHRVVDLSSLLELSFPGDGESLSMSVFLAPGTDDETFLVTFQDAARSSIATARIRSAPQGLAAAADLARAVIIGSGEKGPDDPPLSAALGEALLGADYVHPALLAEMSLLLEEEILALEADGDVDLLAAIDLARAVIIGSGIQAGGGGVVDSADPERRVLVEIADDGEGSFRSQFFEVAILRERSAPVSDPAPWMFASPSGLHVLVAWLASSELSWVVDLEGGGWSTPAQAALGQDLSLEEALSGLEQLARRR